MKPHIIHQVFLRWVYYMSLKSLFPFSTPQESCIKLKPTSVGFRRPKDTMFLLPHLSNYLLWNVSGTGSSSGWLRRVWARPTLRSSLIPPRATTGPTCSPAAEWRQTGCSFAGKSTSQDKNASSRTRFEKSLLVQFQNTSATILVLGGKKSPQEISYIEWCPFNSKTLSRNRFI